MDATTTERTKEEMRYQSEMMAHGQGPLSARTRATTEYDAAVAGLEHADREIAALRTELAQAEAREAHAASRAALADRLPDAASAREEFDDTLRVTVRRLATHIQQTADALEGWRAEYDDRLEDASALAEGRGPLGVIGDMEAEGVDASGVRTDPKFALRTTSRDPVEREVLALVQQELERRASQRVQPHLAPPRRATTPPEHPEGAYAMLTRRAGEVEGE